MGKINLIAAADKNWGIGRKGGLLFHIKEDMRFFRSKTLGQVIIVGRRTLESFPGARPLPDRVNIVLTRDRDYDGKGALVVHSREDLPGLLDSYPDQEVFIAGGGSIYRLLLPLCHRAYITRVDALGQADTYMPDLDHEPGWFLKEEGEEKEENGIRFRFDLYEKGGN